MNKTVNIGILGFGWVARDFMVKAIAAEKRAKLVAVCSVKPIEMEFLPHEIFKYTDIDAFLRHEDLDAVYIATPNYLHKQHTIACKKTGIHVLCEKPLATSAQDAQEMIAFAKSGKMEKNIYVTAYDQRFHPAHLEIHKLLKKKALGTITQVRLDYACWLPKEWSADNWRIDPQKAGGGAVIDLAPHGLDLLEMVLEDQIIDISLYMQSQVQDYEVDDGGVIMLRFTSGILGTLHLGYNRPDNLSRRKLEIIGTKAMLTATNTMGQEPGGTLTLTQAKDGKTYPVDFDTETGPFQLQLANFIEQILDKKKPLRSPEDDLRLFLLLDSALKNQKSWP